MLDCLELHSPTSEKGFCSFLVAYPLDPAITLKARFYDPEPIADLVPRLPAIAERMREIALCLDVTAEPPADPETAIAELLGSNPTLEGCDGKLSS